MTVLPVELRNKLERTIVEARDVAEAGAKAALEAIAVHHHEPYGHMSPEERKLRNHLRARARQLGDKQNRKGELEITHLVWECAYEHWHRMLFARFLAENDLLIEPEMSVVISLEECEELAKEEGKELWTLASEFAQRMLPQIFRPNDPVLKVTLAREHRLKLENLLNALEPSVFTASDSLGWVYQFWQSKRKKEVNQSGNKIGADELPAVTQVFTEPYMVSFLLDNSLGAWWAARRLTEVDLQNAENEDELRIKASLPGMPLRYLRFVKLDNDIWAQAAGTFDRWPEHLSELKILDPCCGSGHFLVAAFLMLVPIRIEMEGLSTLDAINAVLKENLYGLEIDKRCVELAAFAMALTAWRFPNAGGYRPLPDLNVACSGLAISAKKEEWLSLAGSNINLGLALEELYKQFKDAPELGSLINPEIGLVKGSLFEPKWENVNSLLTKALSNEEHEEKTEMAVVAKGLAKAAELIKTRFDLIVTNVPYKTKGDLSDNLQTYITTNHFEARSALETSFLNRCLKWLSNRGVANIVLPQNMLFLKSYVDFRKKLLKINCWKLLVWLGDKAFQTPVDASPILISIGCINDRDKFAAIDISSEKDVLSKARQLKTSQVKFLYQRRLIDNPDSRITYHEIETKNLISKVAECYQGILTGDKDRFFRKFWEIATHGSNWDYSQTTNNSVSEFGGMTDIIYWQSGAGELHDFAQKNRHKLHDMHESGNRAWGKYGVALNQQGNLKASRYLGDKFDGSLSILFPAKQDYVAAIWAYCSTSDFSENVRKIDKKRNVTNATFLKVPFDLEHWKKVAQEKYPNGLPMPYSEDYTQWIFHGYPSQSNDPLQVAVARLLGYKWPAEIDKSMELSDKANSYVKKNEVLVSLADDDGIVCIPSVRGEEPAVARFRQMLAIALNPNWSPVKEQELINATGANTSNLDEWLRDHFFEQHCKLFHQRPFIWHIWDGRRRDGFHALVNYHKLAEGNGKGRQLIENLTYSYLGDWITRQKEGVKRGEEGAEDRLTAAVELQKRLIAIIEGETPFDIFVRWKPIEEQPIGWEPDINDGVRLNIRPFLAQDIPGGRKGAGILRWKPNINWNKDRGKEPFRSKEQYPWFWKNGEFTGDRANDIHLSNAEKRHAREKTKGK